MASRDTRNLETGGWQVGERWVKTRSLNMLDQGNHPQLALSTTTTQPEQLLPASQI